MLTCKLIVIKFQIKKIVNCWERTAVSSLDVFDNLLKLMFSMINREAT